jgi:hypothetical protein
MTTETAGLPKTPEEARARGEQVYLGKPCLKHGPKAPRYTSSAKCVECTREARSRRKRRAAAGRRQEREGYRKAREDARKQGLKFFFGQPCPKHGAGVSRYTSTGKCMACRRAAEAKSTKDLTPQERQFLWYLLLATGNLNFHARMGRKWLTMVERHRQFHPTAEPPDKREAR